MSLHPITPGLRPVRNNSKSTVKVSLAVPAGDTLYVSVDVAGQLLDARQGFTEPDAPAADAPVAEKAAKPAKK